MRVPEQEAEWERYMAAVALADWVRALWAVDPDALPRAMRPALLRYVEACEAEDALYRDRA